LQARTPLRATGFTKILCNPPYHTDFSVAKHFIEKGFNRLAIGGAMWMVTKAFEGYYVLGRAFPQLVSVIVAIISVLFMVHAVLALRKFPADYRQYRIFLGHKNLLRHPDTGLWWLQVVTGFLLFFLAARMTAWAMARFGSRWGFTELADVASMPLLTATLTVLTLLAQPAINGYARRVEHEADVFAVELTRDNDAGARAFLKLGSQNRSDPEPPTWVTMLHYTHPPLMNRIRFVLDYRPWVEGKPNRYYHGPPAAP